jgi:hypothetical protein
VAIWQLFQDIWQLLRGVPLSKYKTAGTRSLMFLRGACFIYSSSIALNLQHPSTVCPAHGVYDNLHLVALPMRERHTGLYMFDLISDFFNALSNNWKEKLITFLLGEIKARGLALLLMSEICCEISDYTC